MRSFLLAGLLVAGWVLSWWGPRRLRLWFALLAPFGAVAAIVLAFMAVPRGSCDHGCVQGWADNVDGSEGLANALITFPVAVAIAVLTGLVELVLFVRRTRPAPAPQDVPLTPPPADQKPSWSDLTRGPSRRD